MLKQIDSQIWVKEQPFKYFGLEVGTRMTVIRLQEERICLISPVKLDKETISEIASLGTVQYIISPNLFHYLYVSDCQKNYPHAQTITVPGLLAKVPEIKSDYIFTQDEIDFNSELEYFLFAGFKVPLPSKIVDANEVVVYHPASKSLIITDLAFHLDNNFPLVTQFSSRILGCYQSLRPSILEKIINRDRTTLTRSINRVLAWDFERVIMAHGTIIETHAKQRLKEGYEWFLETKLS